MKRKLRQKVFAGAAIVVLVTGGAIAAVSATGQGTAHKRRGAHQARAHRGGHALAAAASYLGIPRSQIVAELRSGKALAQIAGQTSGKSAAGLVQALLAARRSQLAALEAKLPQRIGSEVNRPGGLAGGPHAARHGSAASAARVSRLFARPYLLAMPAAGYLGLSEAQLETQLLAGKTLAQVAEAPGKSRAGLVDALVAAKRAQLAKAVANGRLTKAKATRLESRLTTRAAALVTRNFAAAGASR